MVSSSAGFVIGLTAAAFTTIGVLGHQAAVHAPPELERARVHGTPGPGAAPAPHGRHRGAALPARSGQGERVVYSVDGDRVWLVGPGGAVRRTFEVTPSTVDPAPGAYTVTSRSRRITGSDGVPVEHVVRFTTSRGVSIGFSAALDGSTAPPDPGLSTGGIRQSRADGDAMWEFATIGRQVVVVR